MKNLLLVFISILAVSCNMQDNKSESRSGTYTVTYKKDGETVTETMTFQDTSLQRELQRITSDPDYKLKRP